MVAGKQKEKKGEEGADIPMLLQGHAPNGLTSFH
jgi:hypothetical protein